MSFFLLAYAERGETEQLALVLETNSGRDVNTAAVGKANKLWTPLHAASANGHCMIAMLLLNKRADVNVITEDEGRTPLHYAAAAGKLDCVSALCSADADVNKGDKNAQTPLQLAVSESHHAVVAFLAARASERDLRHIVHLDLSNQQLEAFPPFLGGCTNLKKLKLRGNPLSTVPLTLRDGSNLDAILRYVREIAISGRVLWTKAKFVMLGKEGGGKTCLLKRFSGQRHDMHSQTIGVDVSTFVLDSSREITCFDFGGLESFYPTYDYFLGGQCLFFVVFRMSDPDSISFIQYWLRRAAVFAHRGARIIVVGTHLDEVPSPEEQASIWSKVFQTVAPVVDIAHTASVCCKTGAGIKELERAVVAIMDVAGLGREPIPASHIDTCAWILRSRDKRKKASFADCSQALPCLSAVQIRLALRFLTDAGLCLFIEWLDLLVLDVQWLADILKQVVPLPTVGAVAPGFRDGVVKLAALKQQQQGAWQSMTDEEVLQLMGLVERLLLAFRTQEKTWEKVWVVPALLRGQPSAAENDSAECPPPPRPPPKRFTRLFERVYAFEALPASLMSRLLGRLHARSQHARVLEMWRDAVKVESPDKKQLAFLTLEGEEDSACLRIQCFDLQEQRDLNAPTAAILFTFLITECSALLNDLYWNCNVKPFREIVSCPHCLNQRKRRVGTPLSMERCVRFLVDPRTHFECSTKNTQVAVPTKELAPDVSLLDLRIFDQTELVVDMDPIAASKGAVVVSRALWSRGGVVVVKELNADKARRWRGQSVEQRDHDENQTYFHPALFNDFQKEACTMSALQHPNLVSLYGLIYNPLRLVVEYCAEGDLFHALEKGLIWGPERRVPLNDARALIPRLCWKVMADVARGMMFLHAQQLLLASARHDLRSPNIMLVSLDPSASVVAKVSDFGLSTIASTRATKYLPNWEWMAPELLAGANYSPACDVYAFSMVMIEVLTQQLPFSAAAIAMEHRKVISSILQDRLRPAIPLFVPTWLCELIQQAWDSDAEKRPSFSDCLYRLERAASSSAPSTTNTTRRRLFTSAPKTRVVFEDLEGAAVLTIASNSDEVWVAHLSGQTRVYSVRFAQQERVEGNLLGGARRVGCVYSPVAGKAFLGLNSGDIILVDPKKAFVDVKAASESIRGIFSETLSKMSGSRQSPKNGRSPPPSPRPSASRDSHQQSDNGLAEITVLAPLASGVVVCGSASGLVSVLSGKNENLASKMLHEPISCGSPVLGIGVWLGVGKHICEIRYRNNVLAHRMIEMDAHEGPVRALVACSRTPRVWSAGSGGDVCVFDTLTGERKYAFKLEDARVHCMCSVEIQQIETVWVGCNDHIRVFDSISTNLRCILPLPQPGDVTAICNVVPDVVWVGVRNRLDKGSLYIWDFSQ